MNKYEDINWPENEEQEEEEDIPHAQQFFNVNNNDHELTLQTDETLSGATIEYMTGNLDRTCMIYSEDSCDSVTKLQTIRSCLNVERNREARLLFVQPITL
jgi:hypothetical protein